MTDSLASKKRPASAPAARASGERIGPGWTAFEIVWIFLIFCLMAMSPTPDAGESAYLVKAKHYWDQAWCAGDLFLESADTHLGFYWTFGWLTRYSSLDAATWMLRFVAWGLLAWAWQRLSAAIVPRPLFSLLSAGLMLLFAHQMHWAREVILRGGVEGKTFAYVAVLLALGEIVRTKWSLALLLAGVAGMFHVLVGGWCAIAIGLAWLAAGSERPRLRSLIPGIVGGLMFASLGLVPTLALILGPQPANAAEAARTYVFDRLAHHLVFHRFGTWYHVRHAVLLAAWGAAFWLTRKEPGLFRLQLVVGGTVLIALVGIVLDQALVIRANLLGQSLEEYQLAAAPWLKFYWFRVEDVLVPIGVALAATLGISRVQVRRPELGNWLLIGAMLAAAANVVDSIYWRNRLGVPGAVIQQQPTADTRLTWWWESAPETLTAREWQAAWRNVCQWIGENTPPEARFLTPRNQQTFKWHAGRTEVATRKDIPQDAASILAWRAALDELYPNDMPHRRHDLAEFSDEQLIALARKYDCQYIVIDQSRAGRRIGLPQVYPIVREDNRLFAVYRVPLAGR
ncbi:MAG TPA: DUF6798 domain-containing protein [Pirellulaceae bacterium]|nr:DUF6798 domain-containing protein [Pirellulaceae bacterium]